MCVHVQRSTHVPVTHVAMEAHVSIVRARTYATALLAGMASTVREVRQLHDLTLMIILWSLAKLVNLVLLT
jgi:hypothetical protein